MWRDREGGPLHAPEFTLLEWYRAERPYGVLMEDCAALLRLAAETAGSTAWSFRGRDCDPFAEPSRITLAQAFATFADIDLLATLGPWGAGDRDALAAAATGKGVRVAADDGWSDVFSRVLTERIEPNLGVEKPTILYEYPAPEAALARRSPTDARVAERFELYACGVELANCFGELTDAQEQRARFTADMDEKERLYGERHPLDEELSERAGADAASLRRRARLRPAGHARLRRDPHRPGDLEPRAWDGADPSTIISAHPRGSGDPGLQLRPRG